MSGVRGQARAADAPAQLPFSRCYSRHGTLAGRTPSTGASFSPLYIDGHLSIQLVSTSDTNMLPRKTQTFARKVEQY